MKTTSTDTGTATAAMIPDEALTAVCLLHGVVPPEAPRGAVVSPPALEECSLVVSTECAVVGTSVGASVLPWDVVIPSSAITSTMKTTNFVIAEKCQE